MTEQTPEAVQAIEAEAAAPRPMKPLTRMITHRGLALHVPAKPTARFMWLSEKERFFAALESLLGDEQWERFLSLEPAPDTDDVEALTASLAKVYGVGSPGNS